MIDGMRQPDFPDSNQGAGTYTREQPDPRGHQAGRDHPQPAWRSTGSDALGGVVAYITKDPRDYMKDGKSVYASVKGAYSGANQQFAGPSPARCAPGLSSSWASTRGATATNSIQRRPLSPPIRRLVQQRLLSPSWCCGRLKSTRSRIQGAYTQGQQSTQMLSGVGNFPALFARIFDRRVRTTQTYRIAAQWHNAPIGFVDRIDFGPTSNSDQHAGRHLAAAAALAVRSRQRQDLAVLLQTRTSPAPSCSSVLAPDRRHAQRLHHGLSFAYTTTTRPRDVFQITLATGARTQNVGAWLFPTRTFPTHRRSRLAPTSRTDHRPRRQADAPASTPRLHANNRCPTATSRNSTGATLNVPSSAPTSRPRRSSVRSILQRHLRPTSSTRPAFARRPTTTPISASPMPPRSGQILPNANLKPETANSFEIGYRGNHASSPGFGQCFTFQPLQQLPEDGRGRHERTVTQFQYVNLTNVTIWGVRCAAVSLHAGLGSAGLDQRSLGAPISAPACRSVSKSRGRRRRAHPLALSRAASTPRSSAPWWRNNMVSSRSSFRRRLVSSRRDGGLMFGQHFKEVQCRPLQHHQRQVLELSPT